MTSVRFDLPTGDMQLSLGGGTLSSGPGGQVVADGSEPLLLRASRRPGERLVGLGEQFGRLEQSGRHWRGRTRDMLLEDPRDTYFPLPFLLSSAGYGLLIDTQAVPVWDLRPREHWTVVLPPGRYDIHVFTGAPKQIVSAATAISGRPPVPAAWMLGVWKTLVGGTKQALSEAERLADEDLGVDACWVYDHYDEATNSGCGASGWYAPGDYPDLRALTDGIHDAGFRALGYVQPCLYYGSAPYATADQQGWLVRTTDSPAVVPFFNPKTHPGELALFDEGGAFVDLTIADAVTWYQGLLAETLDQGFDGWMQDMGEQIPDDVVYADGTPGDSNAYPLLYHRAAHPVWSSRHGAGVFARSGTIGSLAYVPVMWPGDQHCEWGDERGLGSVLPAGPSAGLSGVGAWGPDIAGIVDGVAGGSQDEELWIRWCQYGALTPVMRDHLGFKLAGPPPVDLWTSERTIGTWRRYARLHRSLQPELCRLAEETSATGIPVVRALLLEYPDHDEAWTINDQYLLGSDYLVAPVHAVGARSRRVWFPPGAWSDWWSGTVHHGPAWHAVPAPLDCIPLFRKTG